LLSRISPREAIGIFEECLKLLNPAGDGVRIAQIFNNLALAYANAGDWTESETYYRRSLDIKRTAADVRGQALTLFNLARVYQSLDKKPEAGKALREAASLFETVHDMTYTARTYRELARLARTAGPCSEVETFVHTALEFYRRAGDSTELSTAEREFKPLLCPPSRSRRWIIWALALIGLAILTTLVILAVD
jgi:tetratricopeptide (TPR) repeat protein